MRNIKIIAPSKDFPAAGKRHALRGKLSSRWKTPRAPRETFQPLENATRFAGNFPAAGKRHALRGRLSSRWKTSCVPRETFASCEKRAVMGQQLLLGLCLLLLTLIGAGCSTTKNLPEGEVLYEGIKRVTIAEQDPSDDGENTVSEINAALAYPPNNALLGSSSIRIPLPVGLWVYNAFVNKKGKIGQWIFKKFAAKPVLISTVNPEVRVKVAQNLLREYGYFQGSTGFEILTDEKNPRKAKIAYEIHMGKAYTLDDIRYTRMRRRTDSIIQSTAALSKLKVGDNFNVVRLQEERERIAALLRDNGYFYYRPDFITYDADTLLSPGKVSLRVKPKEGLPIRALRPWRIGDISLYLSGYQNEPPTDSIRYKDLTIHYEGKLRVRPKVIYDRLFFKSGELYSQDKQEQSQTALSRLGIFRYTDMQYTPRDTTRRQDTLNLRINATYDLPIDGELEVNVTSKSNDQVGPGAVFSVTKRNIFGGGETFNVQMKGSYEWQTGNKLDNNSSKINSYELGLSATLKFPRILFPVPFQLSNKYPSSTSFRIYADQMNRARFFKLLAFGGVLLFDNRHNAALLAQNAAVSRGIAQHRRQNRHTVARSRLQAFDRFGLHQRHIAQQHQSVFGRRIQFGQRTLKRVSGSHLRLLQRKANAFFPGKCSLNGFGTAPHHHNRAGNIGKLFDA